MSLQSLPNASKWCPQQQTRRRVYLLYTRLLRSTIHRALPFSFPESSCKKPSQSVNSPNSLSSPRLTDLLLSLTLRPPLGLAPAPAVLPLAPEGPAGGRWSSLRDRRPTLMLRLRGLGSSLSSLHARINQSELALGTACCASANGKRVYK